MLILKEEMLQVFKMMLPQLISTCFIVGPLIFILIAVVSDAAKGDIKWKNLVRRTVYVESLYLLIIFFVCLKIVFTH